MTRAIDGFKQLVGVPDWMLNELSDEQLFKQMYTFDNWLRVLSHDKTTTLDDVYVVIRGYLRYLDLYQSRDRYATRSAPHVRFVQTLDALYAVDFNKVIKHIAL